MLAVGGHLLGEIEAHTFKMASLFGGGVAGTREELCGALSAGVMVIGALYGRSSLAEDETLARQLAVEYRQRFLARFGATQCAKVREPFAAPDGSTQCAPVAEGAAEMLMELLAEV
jgi:C_GCAxxG_C_C family probable redox protein